jgi:OmpA-OmpF porin, OOP family
MHGFKSTLAGLVLGVSLALIFSCGSSDNFISRDNAKTLKNGGNNVKTDTVYFLLDNSGSMAEQYKNQQKSTAARKVLYRLNRAFPDDTNAGLRGFGENFFGFESTKLLYGITKFCGWDFGNAVKDLGSPRGAGNMESALRAAGEDIKNLSGRIALVILSDGKLENGDPIAAAAALKEQLGPRLCIYTIQLGNDQKGGEILGKIVDAGRCGTAVNAENLESGENAGAYVKNLFRSVNIAEQPKPDAAIAIAGKKSMSEAKPEITEKPRKKVKTGRIFLRLQVRFDNGKADIKPVYADEIKKVADFMKQYPDIKVAIEGHTDSLGQLSMNMRLSRQRADAVIKELVEQYGIDGSRIKAVGYGPKRPIASNATEKGREKNRRVEARRVSG